MSKQVNDNPTSNANITLTTYAFSSTGASGTVNASGGVDFSNLTAGDSVFLSLGAGSSNGFTDVGEYFITSGPTSGAVQLSTTEANAIAGTPDLTASGDAGSGTLYPNYKVGGVPVTNTAGNCYIRGVRVSDTGWGSFSLHTTSTNGEYIPFMVKDISSSGTTASNIVGWSN